MNAQTKLVRCAIYTRKSTEEGLERSFNSLQAQREACEAYVKSQVHEGWIALPESYDDGGHSGGSMDRPALRLLLDRIQQKRIDAVLVYKVDRLTRSLRDFAKIIDIFEANQVSFISVTQSFSTSTSMGRLTLNVLLSFAQFEREIASERIRDKIAASKRKGIWMGGIPPLGYDVQNRKLVVNDREAPLVQHIFCRYLDLGSVNELVQELRASGTHTKVRTSKDGRRIGGCGFCRSTLYWLLRNPIYLGRISHRGNIFPGNHAAIVDQTTWDRVQMTLRSHTRRNLGAGTRPASSMLVGLLYDDRGNLMSPSYTTKRDGRRIRYYFSRALLKDNWAPAGSFSRVPAGAIEALVLDQVLARQRGFSSDPLHHELTADSAVRSEIERVELRSDSLEIRWRPRTSGIDGAAIGANCDTNANLRNLLAAQVSVVAHCLTVRKTRPGGLGTINHRTGSALVRAVTRAFKWRALIESGRVSTAEEVARKNHCTRSYARQMLALSFLAPDIVDMFLAGTHPSGLTVRGLTRWRIPLSWNQQRRALASIAGGVNQLRTFESTGRAGYRK